MADDGREALITGIGLVSCLGEGADAHWAGLCQGKTALDSTHFAPYLVHPIAPLELDRQIPKRSDQRQMEAWQRIGVYAAGLALDSAGVKGNADILSRMDMIVAAGGGERDCAVDESILADLATSPEPERVLNTRLMSDLRPTLFLAQLANLLAGNISIVHGVTGSSRTFMGEEQSGVDAVRIAFARIKSGQSEIALVGGALNGERKDLILLYELGGQYLKGEFRPVWARAPEGGLVLGSLGAFLVLEERAHAERRGAAPIARLSCVASERTGRNPGDIGRALERMWAECGRALSGSGIAIISGASGAEPATSEERRFLETHAGIPVRATGSYIGHAMEPQFIMNIGLASLALQQGQLFPTHDPAGFEQPMDGRLAQAVVTSIGFWRGEGLALVEAP